MVEVTQADRDRVAEYVKRAHGGDESATVLAYRNGSSDRFDLIQAFAAHRIAAYEEAARVVEAEPDTGISYQHLWRIATAIRALKEQQP